MYFAKFIGWFWNTHLKNGEHRFFFCLFGLLLGLGPISVLCYFYGPNVLLWYFGGLLTIAFFVSVYNFFAFIHRAYVKWQAQVFDKLRQGNEPRESSW
jgi:hypothetical protein